ncbi:MAG: hypothetical protein HYX60_02575, partial [Legionella longbeachae]|nr:hypothetical protein [Legionella longbeachae]
KVSYLEAIKGELQEENFNKRSIEEKIKFVNLLNDCSVFRGSELCKSTFDNIKVSYLEAIKGELQEENFNKRSIEEKIKFVNLLNNCSVIKESELCRNAFDVIKLSYLKTVQKELQEENFNKRPIEEKIKFVNLLNNCSVFKGSEFHKDFVAIKEYFDAYNKLNEIIKKNENLENPVKNLLKATSANIKHENLKTFTKYLNNTHDLILQPNQPSKIEQHNKNIKEAIGNRRWGPVVGGALLCIAGILLTAAAITLTVLTFGVSSPLTLPVMVAGSSVTAAGIATAAGVAVGLTAMGALGVGLASKGGVFAHSAHREVTRQGTIANEMEEIKTNLKCPKN